MKAITVAFVVHKISLIFVRIVQTCKKSCLVLLAKMVMITTFLSVFVIPFTYHQDFLSDKYCYKTLSNRFYESITSAKLITLINSTIKMYQFQKNGLFGA